MASYADSGTGAAITEESLAAKANTLFARLVKDIPGVIYVEPFGGEAIGEQSFRVYIRDGDLEAEASVYEAKGAVYDRYPGAELDVEVLEESDLSYYSSANGLKSP